LERSVVNVWLRLKISPKVPSLDVGGLVDAMVVDVDGAAVVTATEEEVASTLPDTTFREELLVSALLSCEVALLADGTELLSLNTRVVLTTTDPFVNV